MSAPSSNGRGGAAAGAPAKHRLTVTVPDVLVGVYPLGDGGAMALDRWLVVSAWNAEPAPTAATTAAANAPAVAGDGAARTLAAVRAGCRAVGVDPNALTLAVHN